MIFWDPAKPNEEVTQFAELIKPGMDILDMGANEGCHSLFFADQGCRVVAVEPNPDAFGRLKRNASEHPRDIIAIIDQLLTFQPDRLFDAIICTMVLHFFPAKDITPANLTMQSWTNPGGYIVISAYSDKNPPGKRPYLFRPNELADFYKGRDIIKYEEKPTPWFSYPAGSELRRNEAVYLTAQKPG